MSLVMTLFVCYSQKSNEVYFKASSTEMYVKNVKGEWDLYQKNGSTNITIVLEENFISIQAQKPSIYRIYKSTSQPIETEKLEGSRYNAKDLKTEEYCTVDVLRIKSTSYYVISIVNDFVNLRYFVDSDD